MSAHLFFGNRERQSDPMNELVRRVPMADGSRPDRILVRSGGKIIFLHAEEVDWIQGARNYVRIYVGNHFYLLRERMSVLEKALAGGKFVRIHRSIIVNTDKIKELQPCNNGEYMVILRDGKELSMSRSYRARLREFLQASFVTGNRGAI